MKAVVLAAGMGSRLLPLTHDRPKPMVAVGGTPLLVRALDRLAEVGIAGANVIVVTGYRREVLEAGVTAAGHAPTFVFNEKYEPWNSFYSLACARDAVAGDAFLTIEGDVLFDGTVLPRVLAARGPGVLATVVRPDCDAEAMKVIADADGRARALAKTLDPALSMGEFIGIARIDGALAGEVFDDLARFVDEGITHQYYDHSYHRLAERGAGPFYVEDIADCLAVEIDDLDDLARAERLLGAEA